MERRPDLKKLKSRKGGISGLVLEITVTAFMLMLIVVVIQLFRGNMNIVSKTAQKTEAAEKIKSQVLVPLDKSVVSGNDIISVIRYYARGANVSIEVNQDGSSHAYISEDYDSSVYNISREAQFTAAYTYNGSEPTRIIYTSGLTP